MIPNKATLMLAAAATVLPLQADAGNPVEPNAGNWHTWVISSGADTSTAAATSTIGPPPPAAISVPRNLSIVPQPRTSGPAPGLPSDCSNE